MWATQPTSYLKNRCPEHALSPRQSTRGEHVSDPLHASVRPARGSLALGKLTRHHAVLGLSPDPRAGPLSRRKRSRAGGGPVTRSDRIRRLDETLREPRYRHATRRRSAVTVVMSTSRLFDCSTARYQVVRETAESSSVGRGTVVCFTTPFLSFEHSARWPKSNPFLIPGIGLRNVSYAALYLRWWWSSKNVHEKLFMTPYTSGKHPCSFLHTVPG